MLKVDMHVHTEFSPDSALALRDVIRSAQRKNLSCLVIADHNTVEGALRLRELAPFKVIVGEEIKTSAGEIIGLFVSERIPPLLTAEDTVARIKDQGGLVYVPHPFDRLRKSPLKTDKLLDILHHVDILEVCNSRCLLESDNKRAVAFAERHGLLRGAGSDAHAGFEIGQAYVELPPFETRDDFLRSLRQGQVIGRLSSPLVHFLSSWSRLRKKTRTGRPP